MKSVIPFVDPTGPSGRAFVILFVDDDEAILSSIASYLRRAMPENSIVTAPNGPAALDVLRAQPVDIILTDYRMPDMDGLAFLEEARKLAPLAPRLMMTAYADVDLATRAVNEQAVSKFLTKPISPEALLEALRSVIGQIASAEARKHALERMMGRSGP